MLGFFSCGKEAVVPIQSQINEGVVSMRTDDCDCVINVIDISNADIGGVAVPWFVLSGESPTKFGTIRGTGYEVNNSNGQLVSPPSDPISIEIGNQSVALVIPPFKNPPFPIGTTIDDLSPDFSITIQVVCSIETDKGLSLSISTKTLRWGSANSYDVFTNSNGSIGDGAFFDLSIFCDGIIGVDFE